MAWAVIAPDGFVSLLKTRARAEFWAVQCRGVIRTLHYPIEFQVEPDAPDQSTPKGST